MGQNSCTHEAGFRLAVTCKLELLVGCAEEQSTFGTSATGIFSVRELVLNAN